MKQTFQVRGFERLKNSYLGNPTYMLYLKDSNGDYLKGRTASNAACAYVMPFSERFADITYHFTKSGNMIIELVDNLRN